MKAIFTVSFCFLLVAVLAVSAADDDCPKVCPFLYEPHCAADESGHEEVFNNMCLLKQKNCEEDKKYTLVKVGTC